MRTIWFPIVSTISGLGAVVIVGFLEFAILIPRGFLPDWVHIILAVLLISLAVLSIMLLPLHLLNLRRRRNTNEPQERCK